MRKHITLERAMAEKDRLAAEKQAEKDRLAKEAEDKRLAAEAEAKKKNCHLRSKKENLMQPLRTRRIRQARSG